MRTNRITVAAILAVAALSANAQPRPEPMVGPFTYDVLGATPSLSFGRKAARAAEAAQPAPRTASAPARAGAPVSGAFTYQALGATPRAERKKQDETDFVTRQPVR